MCERALGPARTLVLVALVGTAFACRDQGAAAGSQAQGPVRPAPAAAAPPPPPRTPYRKVSAEERKIAQEAGFPTDFAACHKTPGARTAIWSCGYKKDSHIAHDATLSPCAPLVGHAPNEEFGIGVCGLIFWDPEVKLPADWKDCKERFVDEPGVVHVPGQDLCLVFVSVADEALFAECQKRPFNEYREGFCRFPLAGPNWTPRGKLPEGN